MDTLREVLNEQLNFVKLNPVLSVLTVAGIFIAIGLMIWLAWRQSTTSKPPLRERTIIVLLGVAFGLLFLNFFFPGDFVRGDGPLHIARSWLVLDAWNNGELPIWSNRVYFGSPGEMYYGLLSFLTFAATSKLSGLDIFASTKIVLWLLHIASGLLMYSYARTRSLKTPLAILAALAYVLSWQHFGVVRRFGILPLAFIYVLIPLFFLLLEYVLKKRFSLLFASVAGGVLCALAALTHVQYGAYLCLTYFAVLLWIGLVNAVYRDWRALREIATLMLGTGVIAALLGGWFVVPALLERSYLSSTPELIGTWSLSAMLEALLSISLITRLFESWGQGYVGLFILIPAAIGLVFAAYRLVRKNGLTRANLVLGYPFLMVVVGFLLLAPIKRYTGIWLFFVCIVAAYGVKWIVEWFATAPARSLRLQQAAIALILLELGLSLLLVGDFLDIEDVNTEVARLQTQVAADGMPGRIMVFKPTQNVFWRAQDTMFTGASIVFGGQLQAATHTHDYMAAISTQLAEETADGHPPTSTSLLDLLRLMNIRYIVTDDQGVFEVPAPSPVLFAPALEVTDATDPNGVMGMNVNDLYEDRAIQTSYVNAVVAGMNLHPDSPTSDFILTNQPITDAVPAPSDCFAEQPLTVANAVEQHTSFRFDYNTCADGYLRLAYAYFPLLRLEVDGVDTPFYPDALNMIVFRAPAGEHHVTLTATVSPLRLALFGLAAATALLCLLWMVWRLVGATRAKTAPDLQVQPQ